jgi:hypothetical protein
MNVCKLFIRATLLPSNFRGAGLRPSERIPPQIGRYSGEGAPPHKSGGTLIKWLKQLKAIPSALATLNRVMAKTLAPKRKVSNIITSNVKNRMNAVGLPVAFLLAAVRWCIESGGSEPQDTKVHDRTHARFHNIVVYTSFASGT